MRDLRFLLEEKKTVSLRLFLIFLTSNIRLKSSHGDGGTVLTQIDTVPIFLGLGSYYTITRQRR